MSVFHSRFGTVATTNDAVLSAFTQHITTGDHTVRVFTTGPLRYHYYRDGGKSLPHARVDTILAQVSAETHAPIVLVYLRNDQEALYGMQTMLEHSKVVLDGAIAKAGVDANVVGIVHSGTTSFQVGEYDRTTGTVSNLNSFDYGTNNPNESAFQDLCQWFGNSSAQHFFSFGSESYAVPSGKIATTNPVEGNELHSDLDSMTRAYAAARKTMDAARALGKTYIIPERKAFEVKTSAALALRKMYPDGIILDWGGGQIKNEESGLSVKVAQTVLFEDA